MMNVNMHPPTYIHSLLIGVELSLSRNLVNYKDSQLALTSKM